MDIVPVASATPTGSCVDGSAMTVTETVRLFALILRGAIHNAYELVPVVVSPLLHVDYSIFHQTFLSKSLSAS